MATDGAEPRQRLTAFLAAVRLRLRLRQLGRDGVLLLGVTAAAMLGFLLLVGSLDHVPSVLRGAGGVLVAAALLGGAWVLLRPWLPGTLGWRFRADDPVAALVGERTGAGDLYITAVELARALPSTKRHAAPSSIENGQNGDATFDPLLGSAELARAHLDLAARRLDGERPGRVVDLNPGWRRLGAGAAIGVAYAIVALSARDRIARAWSQLNAPPTVTQETSAEPIVGDLEIALVFPKYTGLPPRTIPSSSGDILALPSTEVTLKARALIPAAEAMLELEDANGKPLERLPAQIDGGASGSISAHFTVGKAAGYRFLIASKKGGVPVREPEPHRIEIDPDHAPKVTLGAPAEELELDGPRRVELAFSVEDDFGLGDVELVWSGPADSKTRAKNGAKSGDAKGEKDAEHRKVIRKAPIAGEPVSRAASGTFEWDTDDLDLAPGVRVSYHLEAKDNDDVSGPNVGMSRTFTLRVYSPREKHEELLTAEQELIDHAVTLLGDRIEAGLDPDGEPAKRVARLLGARGRTEALLDEIAHLAADADKDPLAPKDLKAALTAIAQRLGKLHKDEGEPAKAARAEPAPASAIAALSDGNPKHVAELERDVLLLDDLMSRQRIEQLVAVADEMQAIRDRLQSLFADYKRTRSDALKDEIEKEMKALERKLAELAEKAAALQGEVPDEYVNKEALQDNNDVQKKLDSIRDMLTRGDVDKAMEEMKRLSAAVDKIMSSLEQNLKGFRDERFSAEEKALADLESKLADLEHDQRQLQSQTEDVAQKQEEEARKMMRDRIEPLLKRAREKVAEMKKKVGAVDGKDLPVWNREDLDRARRRIEELGKAIDLQDLEQSREAAQGSMAQLRALSMSVREAEERQWEGAKQQLKRDRERLDEADALAQQILDELDKAQPQPNDLIPPQERKRMESLAEQEESLQRRTDDARKELERRLKEGQSGAPRGMKEASEQMGRAGESLRGNNPRDSSSSEGQAADTLGKLRKEVQGERRPQQQSQQEGAGGSPSKEVVKIPGADEFRAPKEFRQDLLEAMKREAPKEFREQVKRFYEELVK